MPVHFLYELGNLTGGNAFAVHKNNHLLQGIIRTGVRRQGLLFTPRTLFAKGTP